MAITTPHPNLHLVTALACEAKPLIDFYGLRKQVHNPYPVFHGELGRHAVRLVVSGLGAMNAGAATAWLAGREACRGAVWLNIGIAGHASLPKGEAVLVHACRAERAQRSVYPPLVAQWAGKTASLTTVDAATQDYPPNGMLDMEASGYFAVAKRFTSAELLHAIKVISDNHGFDQQQLNAAAISALIEPNMPVIAGYIERLLALACLPQPADYQALIEHLHVSVSHRTQYVALVQNLSALGALDANLQEAVAQARSIQAVLSLLTERLSQQVPVLGAGGACG